MAELYYLQNKNYGYLGNSPFWWSKGGNGYTAYIMGAERMTYDEAKEYIDHDPNKFEMFKCSDIDKRLLLVFDIQDKVRLGTNEPCGWSSGYAPIPGGHQ